MGGCLCRTALQTAVEILIRKRKSNYKREKPEEEVVGRTELPERQARNAGCCACLLAPTLVTPADAQDVPEPARGCGLNF